MVFGAAGKHEQKPHYEQHADHQTVNEKGAHGRQGEFMARRIPLPELFIGRQHGRLFFFDGVSHDDVPTTYKLPRFIDEHNLKKVAAPQANSLNSAMSKNFLAFVGDIYEDLELWYPKVRLEEAGFTTHLAGEEIRTYTGKHHYPAV